MLVGLPSDHQLQRRRALTASSSRAATRAIITDAVAAGTLGTALVVTDDFPAFFLPRMVAAAAEKLKVRLETVDGNGLLPMRAADREHATAYAFRRFLHRSLPPWLDRLALQDPLADPLPAPVPKLLRAVCRPTP